MERHKKGNNIHYSAYPQDNLPLITSVDETYWDAAKLEDFQKLDLKMEVRNELFHE